MDLFEFKLFSPMHLTFLLVWLGLWVFIPFIGRRFLGLKGQKTTAILLALITVVQEIVDYLNRMTVRDLTVVTDLPLQFCHLAQIFSVILLFAYNPLLFEVTYFWGLGGALQAMLTPDTNSFDNWLTLFLFFMHHGLLILIIFWLVFVTGYRCRPWAAIRVLVFTNVVMIPVGVVDWVFDANYMYLRESPVTDSPFISGAWPWYILKMEGVALVMMMILELPMIIARNRRT